MALGPPKTTGIEEYKDVLGTCIQHLQGKMMFGELLQNKVIGSLPDAFPDFDFGWAFFFLELLKKIGLILNGSLTLGPVHKCRRIKRKMNGMSLPYELGFMIPRLPLWACTELFCLNLHMLHLSLLIPGQLWLLSSSLAGHTCEEASRLHAGFGVANKAGRYSEMSRLALALSGKGGLKPHSPAVGGDDQSLLNYLTLWP